MFVLPCTYWMGEHKNYCFQVHHASGKKKDGKTKRWEVIKANCFRKELLSVAVGLLVAVGYWSANFIWTRWMLMMIAYCKHQFVDLYFLKLILALSSCAKWVYASRRLFITINLNFAYQASCWIIFAS
jgi:hypothetical protein